MDSTQQDSQIAINNELSAKLYETATRALTPSQAYEQQEPDHLLHMLLANTMREPESTRTLTQIAIDQNSEDATVQKANGTAEELERLTLAIISDFNNRKYDSPLALEYVHRSFRVSTDWREPIRGLGALAEELEKVRKIQKLQYMVGELMPLYHLQPD